MTTILAAGFSGVWFKSACQGHTRVELGADPCRFPCAKDVDRSDSIKSNGRYEVNGACPYPEATAFMVL